MSYYWDKQCEATELIGKTIILIEGMGKESDSIKFHTSDGDVYQMYHEQDCCESVWLEDVSGNPKDLIDTPILNVDVKTNEGSNDWGSTTYTYYTIATIKGYVDLRWYGESNGYYSESVDFIKNP